MGKMSRSWEFDGIDTPQQFIELARAYLRAAKLLCLEIIEAFDNSKFEDSRVVCFITHHAIELFLKGMILKKRPDMNLHHNVQKLSEEFKKLYPLENLPIPFKITVLGYCDPVQKTNEMQKKSPLDQVYRYPVNRLRKDWEIDHEVFEPNSFLENVILPLKKDFARLSKVED